MSIELITPPTSEPLARNTAKDHLKETDDSPETNSEVDRLIRQARRYAEKNYDLRLVTQTVKLHLDGFPCEAIRPPVWPIASVSSVTYRDTDGAEQTLSTSLYQTDLVTKPARLCPAPGESWPDTECDRLHAVAVQMVCGYGAPADVPDDILGALLLLIGHWYENREAAAAGVATSEIKLGVDSLLRPHGMARIG